MSKLRLRYIIAVLLTMVVAMTGMWLVMYGVFSSRAANDFASSCVVQLVIGFLVIFAVAGNASESRIRAIRHNAGIGALYSCGLFVLGCAVALLSIIPRFKDWSFESCFIKPMFWLGLYGLVPAFIVGMIGSLLVRLIVPADKFTSSK